MANWWDADKVEGGAEQWWEGDAEVSAKSADPLPAPAPASKGILDTIGSYLSDALGPKKEFKSVLEGAAPAPAQASDSLAPVRPEVRKQLEKEWDAATPEIRSKVQQQGGWQGQLAADRAGQYQRADQGALALPSARDTDSRAEAVRGAKVANAGKAQKLQLQELAAQTRSAKEFAVDTYSALGQGLVTVPQLAANVIAPGSALADRLRTEMNALQNAESDIITARSDLMRMSAKERESFAGKYAETAYQLVANPSLGLQEFVRQVPMIVAMVGSGGLGALGGRAAVGAAGRVAPTVALGEAISGGALAAKAAQVGGTAGAVAAASTMSAGDAAGSTYERLMDPRQTTESMLRSNPDYLHLVDEQGMEPGQARHEIAESKSRLSAVLAAPLGVLGFVGAEATLVKRLMGGQSGRFGATQAGKMIAKDNLGEQAEEGLTQVASNYSVGQVDGTQSLMEGVPEAMATAAVTSAPFAAGTAAMQMQARPSTAPALDMAGAQSAALDAWGRYSPKQGGHSVSTLPEVAAPPPAAQAQAASEQAMANIGQAASVDEAIAAATAAVDYKSRAVSLDNEALLAQAMAQAEIEAEALSMPAPAAQAEQASTAAETTQSALAATETVAPPLATPQPITWMGRSGTGYATPEAAAVAQSERTKMRPAYTWSVEPTADGRYSLRGQPVVPTAAPAQATAQSALTATETVASAELEATYATQEQAQAALAQTGIPATLAQVRATEGGFTIAPTRPKETIRALRDKANNVGELANAMASDTVALYSARDDVPVERGPGQALPATGATSVAEVAAIVEDVGQAAKVAFGWEPVAVTGLGGYFGVQYRGITYVDVAEVAAGNRNQASAPAIAIQTIGHETTHNLQNSPNALDQGDFAVLRQAILGNAKPGVVERRTQIEGKGQTYGENEVVADVSGDFWLDPKFWQRLYDLDPSAMRRIAYKFMENAAKLVRVAKGSRLDASSFVNNVEQVREVAAQVWAARAKRGEALFPASAKVGADYNQAPAQAAPKESTNEPANTPAGARADGGIGSRGQAPGNTSPGPDAAPKRAADGRLEGAPSVRGFSGPDPRLVSVAEQYARSIGLKLKPQAEYAKADPERAARIADAYAQMEHAPQDPAVKAAYDNLIRQTTAQYKALEKAGYKFWFIDISTEAGQDYASTPWNAMRDIRANQEMGIFPTDEGFGSSDLDVSTNPLLQDTGIMWPSGSPTGTPKAVLANDLFRAVHDAFGHGLEGAGFRADGEENAWQAHVRLFTGSAVGAITSETRGQNSWLNFGPNGEANRTAAVEDTVFADQKTGLMPAWTWTEGRVGDGPVFSRALPKTDVRSVDLSKYKKITIQDLVGKTIFPTIADRTKAGAVFEAMDGSKLDEVVDLQGGPFFPFIEGNATEGVVWANRGKGILSQKKGKINKRTNGDLLMAVVMGSDRMHGSNMTVANAYLRSVEAFVRDGKIGAAGIAHLDGVIRSAGGQGAGNLAQFPGLTDLTAASEFLDGLSFEDRSAVMGALSKKSAQQLDGESLGLPSMDRVMRETMQDELAGADLGDTVLLVRPNGAEVALGQDGTLPHMTYPIGMKGEIVGVLENPLSWRLLWADFVKSSIERTNSRGKEGTEATAWYDFGKSLPEVTVTQQMADNLASVKYAAVTSPKQARAAIDMALGNWKTSDTTKLNGGVSLQDFMDAVESSDAAPTLSTYSAKELRQDVKSGKMRVFQLGSNQIFFALRYGKPWHYGLAKGVTSNEVELVSVVNNEPGIQGISGPAILAKAIEEGASVLDAFAVKSAKFPDGFLPTLYQNFGFETTAEVDFDASFYDNNKMADISSYWSRNGWNKDAGYPSVVVMKWQGTNEQRAGFTQNYLREGAGSLWSESGADTAAEAIVQHDVAASDSAQQAGPGAGNRDRGNPGSPGPRLGLRAYGVVEELRGLSDAALQNLGITREQINEVEAHAKKLGATPAFSRTDAAAEPGTGAPGKEDGLRDGRARPDAAGGSQVGAGNRGNDGTARPSYGRAREGSAQAVGTHFSKQVRTELDSRFYGTGMRGEESRRLEGEEDIRPRVFFYVDTGTGVSPEANVGGFAHEVQLNNLYDVGQDALGLVKGTRGMGAERANAWERAIMQAGFDGYLVTPDDGPGFAVLVGQHQVPVAPAKPRIKGASAAPQKPTGPKPEVTRAIKDELVRRPVGEEVMQVIRARQAGISLAAPSFKMEFGEARVLASEAAVADAVLAEHPGGFAFGEAPSFSDINISDYDLGGPEDFDFAVLDERDRLKKDASFAGFEIDESLLDEPLSFLDDDAALRTMLQEELEADQRPVRAAPATAPVMPSAKAIKDAGLHAEDAFTEPARIVQNERGARVELPSHASDIVTTELRGTPGRYSAQINAGPFSSFTATKTLDDAQLERYIGRQMAGMALQETGHDIAASYRKGTVLNIAQGWKKVAGMAGAFKLPKAGTDSQSFLEVADDMLAFQDYDVSERPAEYGGGTDVIFKRKFDGAVWSARIDTIGNELQCCTMDLAGSGGLGTEFYAVLGRVAQNRGKTFKSDDFLSGINTYRRTEQALSYALKSGHTGVMLPGLQNRVYGYNTKPKTQEDHDRNLARLALASLRNVEELVPEVRSLRYLPESDTFVNEQGIDQAEAVKKMLAGKEARAFGLGRSTLARAVLTSQMLEGKAIEGKRFAEPVAYSLASAELDAPMLRLPARAPSKATAKSGRIRRTLDELVAATESQESWRTWYDRHDAALANLFGDDAQLFQKILSATSQAATVKSNVGLALKAYDQLLSELPFTGYLPAVIKNLDRIRSEQELQGAKISQYGEANDGNTEAIAVDRHIAMLFFNSKTPNRVQIQSAKIRIRKIAEQLQWEPRQVQAALWAFNQVRLGTDPSQVQSYDTILENKADLIAALRAKHQRAEGGGVPAGRSNGARDSEGQAEAAEVAFSRAAIQGDTFLLPGESGAHQFRRKVQDYFLRVRDVQDAVKAQGGVLTEQTNVYDAEALSHGRANAQLQDFAADQVEPLMEKLVKLGVQMDELSLYAYAMHAAERNAQIAKIDPRTSDGGSGMTNADAAGILQAVQQSGNQAKFDSLHADLMAITQTNRMVMLDEGLITQDEFDALDGMYEHYIPLRGFEVVDEDNKPTGRSAGKGFNIRGAETVRALGRKSRAGQLIENVIGDYQRTVVRAERNQVAKVFLNFVLHNPDAKLWEIDATTTRKSLDRQTGRVARNTVIEKGEDTIAVKVAGREIYVQIKDPLLARAMRKSHADETGEMARDLMRTSGLYTSLLRNTLTRYNPEFALVNTVRDFGFGSVAVLDALGEKGVAKFAAHYAGATAASVRAERRTGDPQAREWDKWFEEYRAAGGITGGFYQKGVEEITGDIRAMMLQAGAQPKGWQEQVRYNRATSLAKSALRVLEFAGSVSENAARVSAYRTAREMGQTRAEAALLAKGLTTNFDRKGEYGQLLNSLYVFFNAAIQGSHKTLQMLQNPKVQGYLAGLTAASAALAFANATAGGDDPDDGMAYWDKIPDYVKERNLVIMLPAGIQVEGAEEVGTKGRYLTIPMQYGLNIPHVVGYAIADLYRNRQDQTRGLGYKEAGLRIASAVAGSFNPFDGSIDLTNPSSMAQAVTPSVFDPVVQMATGTNSFGRDVAPFKSPFDTKPDSHNANLAQTGSPAAKLAQWLNSATGGSSYESGGIDVSPGAIENMVRNLTGGTGMFLYDSVSLAGNAIERYTGGDPDLFIRQIPLARRVYGETAGDIDQGLFYDRRQKIQKAVGVEKGADEAGVEITDPEKLALASLGKDAGKYTKWLSDIRKDMKEVQGDEDMAKGDKRLKLRELRAERDRLTAEFNRDFGDAMREAFSASKD